MGARSNQHAHGPSLARQGEQLLVLLLAMGVVPALFVFRALDDNSLTRWGWVFAQVNPLPFFAILMGSLLAACGAVRLRRPGARGGLCLFLFSYGIGACSWGLPEVNVDVSRYFTQAKSLELHGIGYFLRGWGDDIQVWTDLPLVPFLYGLIFRFLGESRIYIEAFTTLLFSLTVLLTYWIGKSLWHEELGFWAGALLLGIPYLLTQVPSMLVDVPTMFFLTLAIFALLWAIEQGGLHRLILASATLLLAFLSKYSVWLMSSVLPLIALVYRGRGAGGRLGRVGVIALISGQLLVACIALKFEIFCQQLALLLGYQAPGLRRWGESPTSTFLFQIHPFLSGAALLSIWVAATRRDPRYLIIAWPLLLLLLLQVQRIRYMIPVLPMFTLMASYGLQAINAREVRNLVASSAVASSILIALYGYLPFLERTSASNLRRAGQYLDGLREEQVVAFTLEQRVSEVNPAISVPILDLFTKKSLGHDNHSPCPPPKEDLENSPLRFTWEYRVPGYYSVLADDLPEDVAVVVISNEVEQALPQRIENKLRGFGLARVFAVDEDPFRYKTLVRVYRHL